MAEITARRAVSGGLPRERNMGSGRERGLTILPRYGLTGCGRQVPREDVFGPTLKSGWESMVGDEGKTMFQEGKILMGERGGRDPFMVSDQEIAAGRFFPSCPAR